MNDTQRAEYMAIVLAMVDKSGAAVQPEVIARRAFEVWYAANRVTKVEGIS